MSDPVVPSGDSEMRALVERALSAHYELDAEIGRGGMGVVYRARDRRLKRTVAIKVLPPELAFRSEIKTRFLREAETAAQLSHPNIVPIYTVDEVAGLVFFEMAYVSGDNLAKRLHERGVLPVDEVRRILREVADALAYAHERGVVHRDVKPDNILLDAESGRPMVTDFGIARAMSDGGDSRLTATGMAIGTPAYMSPEQAAGERVIDGRSDIYALGIVAYQMLAGEPPFSAASTPAMLVKHISEMPVPITQRRADVPGDLAQAVMLMLEKDPANRFPSAGDLVKALDGGQMPAPPPGPISPPGQLAAAGTAPDMSAAATMGGYDPATYMPTAEEIRRWDAPQVQAFRKRVWPYVYVNGVIVLMAVFFRTNLTGITAIWSIWLAFKYAKLWGDGYDWRDVFQQPRDRALMEVFDDMMEHVRALFDSKKRRALLQSRRQRRLQRRSGGGGSGASSTGAARLPGPRLDDGTLAQAAGSYADTVRQAIADRDEILRLVQSMPAADRDRVPDVMRSAAALHEKVQGLAIALSDLDHNSVPGGMAAYEAEIERLENAANPLDHRASEERVHRLAYLKRQRRAIMDLEQRRAATASRLETCALALRNMKLDVLRLRAGMQNHEHITSLAMNALNLADSVDSAVYVADAVGRGGEAGSSADRR